MLVWREYQSDLGRAYPMYALTLRQINNVSTAINPIDLLPTANKNKVIEVKNACAVPLLIPRLLVLFASDGAQFELTYSEPFNQSLYDYLTLNTNVAAFEFIG